MLTVARGKPIAASRDKENFSADERTVGVVIPTYNHARFLAEAIKSVMTQSRQADQIIVVDDGSTDNPAEVVAEFPIVNLIQQKNSGLSAARNTGLQNCKTSHVIFLDADDRLLPHALESGLACIADRPDCAFVYGGHRLISEDGHPLWSDIVRPLNGDAHLAFARMNLVGPPAAALYRRDCLLAVSGFDEVLRRCQDYDLYLRLACRYPIASHAAIVAEYRKHDKAMSNDYVEMLKEVLLVLELDDARSGTEAHRAALREGRAHYRSFYVSRMLSAASGRWHAGRDLKILMNDLIQAAQWSPILTMRRSFSSLCRRLGHSGP